MCANVDSWPFCTNRIIHLYGKFQFLEANDRSDHCADSAEAREYGPTCAHKSKKENDMSRTEMILAPDSVTNADAIYYKDATELASLIRTKQLSSREVVQAHLDRIENINPKVNAIVTLLAEDALKGADAADKAVKNGEALGLLHGVPFTIKDAIDTAGVLTQRASKIFAGNIPEKDATVVTRFKAAGAIPLAKTNLPEFSAWQETDNLVTGLSRNPWNLERTPGGSSGGESAAIAAGLSPIGIGSDLAISVRGPAALTWIVGLKATHGRIPYTGHWPEVLNRYFHIGPMARRVRDITTAFSIMQGPPRLQRLRPLLLTTNVSNKSGNLLFAQK
jgi:aspartyl-tRNA(Asn)/glutamyl-tRNA(Gln) amidotransferase subunit A